MHKLGTYLLVALPFFLLWSGGAFGLGLGVVGLAVMAGSWFWESPRIVPDRFSMLWTALTVFYIGLSVYFLAMTGLGVVRVGLYLVMFLTGVKLFQRVRLDDYIQLLALSFLLLAASTTFNEDLLFGLFFIFYVVIGVVTFAVYHLRRQLEEAEKRGSRRVRALFSAQYLYLLTALSLVCFVASVLFFFLFPRLGFGFFAPKNRAAVSTSGFSENVDLGSHGKIKTDNTVVMRVQFPEGRPQMVRPFYWRGITFDHYDGVGWSSTMTDRRRQRMPDREGGFKLRSAPSDVRLLRQDIYLEPLDSNVIFSLPFLVRLEPSGREASTRLGHHRQLSVGRGEVYRLRAEGSIGIQYTAFSLEHPPDRQMARRYTPLQGRGGSRNVYLQLPEANRRIRALAEKITADADNTYDKVKAVERHLRSAYTYTTDVPSAGSEPPLEAFLFKNRRGHCEFFATAMVILLRSVGIEARNVNGFMGGSWNEFDSFLAVRNADAHSWVEVNFGEFGWLTFDPTPSAADVRDESYHLAGLEKFYDSLKFRWLKYVIEYDLDSQLELLKQATQAFGVTEEALEEEPIRFRLMDLLESVRTNALPFVLVSLLGLGLWLALRVRRRSRWGWLDTALVSGAVGLSLAVVFAMWKPSATTLAFTYAVATPACAALWSLSSRLLSGRGSLRRKGIVRLYVVLRGLLAQAGLEIDPGEGPLAVLGRVEASELESKALAAHLLRRYMEVRFGGRPLNGQELKELEGSLREIRRSLR
jgi:hypothetical protein